MISLSRENDVIESVYFQITAVFPRIIVRFLWEDGEKYMMKDFDSRTHFKSAYINLNVKNNSYVKKYDCRELWKLLSLDGFQSLEDSD